MKQQPSTARNLALTLLISAAALAGVVFFWFGYVHATCTVGVSGFAATVTFDGPGAPDTCSSMLRNNSSYFYQFQGDPTGTELCVGSYQTGKLFPLQFIVRDTGLLHLVGGVLCKTLQSNETGAQQ